MEKDKLKKICIITGEAGGIGYHLSEGFNKKGYKVIILDINKHKKLSKDIHFIKMNLRLETDYSQHPSRRVGIPRDILNTYLFLAGTENNFINATNLVLDGGMTKKLIYE